MKLYLKAFGLTLVVALVLGGLFKVWKDRTLAKEPEQIAQIDELEAKGLPDFELKDLAGKSVHLSDFKGQIVILSFWASWCGPCLEEFPSMIELVEKMNGKVQLVAVSEDSSKEEIEAFLKAFPRSKNPNIHILWDEDHSVGQKYDADRLPESYIANKNLQLKKKIVGSINWSSPDAVGFMTELTAQ